MDLEQSLLWLSRVQFLGACVVKADASKKRLTLNFLFSIISLACQRTCNQLRLLKWDKTVGFYPIFVFVEG